MTLGVGEQANHQALHDLLRAHHARSAQLLGVYEGGLYVRDLDVEGEVAS
jgi:hypothetical protein